MDRPTADNYCDLDIETINKLIDECFAVKSNAYCPYSQFPVGAALLCPDGTIFKGCNVENASYGLCVCAERNVICSAVAAGHRHFTAIAVASNIKDDFKKPCGACRQVFAEFGLDWLVCVTKPDRSYSISKIRELLPSAFDGSALQLDRHIVNDGEQK